jgi:hypothetical protein
MVSVLRKKSSKVMAKEGELCIMVYKDAVRSLKAHEVYDKGV